VHKTAFWLQELMTAACTLVPQRDTCKLTVLPSTRYGKIKMSSILEGSRSIELVLAVRHGDSDTFVCMEQAETGAMWRKAEGEPTREREVAEEPAAEPAIGPPGRCPRALLSVASL